MQAVEDLARAIETKQRESRKAKHATIYEPRSTTASSLGYRCERRLVYARTKPHDAKPIGTELSSIFEEGNLHQSDVRRELLELGFEALEAERPFRDEALEIGGRIDGMIALSGEHRAMRIPVEIKSTTGPAPKTAQALRDHPGLYGRYFAQMQVYLFLTETECGIFLFKDKILGLWSVVAVELDYDYAESLLKKAERVRDHVKTETLPERLADRSECGGCPFAETVCFPADAECDPMLVTDDAELLSQLEKRERLESSAKEFKAVDDAVKERFKLTRGDRFVVGDASGFVVVKRKHGKGIRVIVSRLSEE